MKKSVCTVLMIAAIAIAGYAVAETKERPPHIKAKTYKIKYENGVPHIKAETYKIKYQTSPVDPGGSAEGKPKTPPVINPAIVD